MRTSLVLFTFVLLSLSGLGCGGSPATTSAAAAPGTPKAVQNVAEIDLGEVDYGRSYDAPFLVANQGTAPLRLALAKKSCDCAEVDVPAELAPGQEAKLTIRWKPLVGSQSMYVLTAEVGTNDPQTPVMQFTVKAVITPLVRVYPEGDYYVDFGDRPLTPDEGRQREIKVFSTELAGFDLNATCSHPGLEVLPLTPLAPGTMLGEHEVKSGYNVVIQANDKLPRGYVQEVLKLDVTAKNQPPRTLTMPVYALVANGTFKVTPEKLVFKKPRLVEEDSLKMKVEFYVPGPNAKLEVVRTVPAFLEAKAEASRPGVWFVTVRIPPNNPAAAKFQPDQFLDGRVVLKAAGSDAEVTVRVKWDPSEK